MTSTIPTHLKLAVYYFGFDPAEVVDIKYLDSTGQHVEVHLRSGDLEWKGKLRAPLYDPARVPVTRVADLVNCTQDCPACEGSGKVPRDE